MALPRAILFDLGETLIHFADAGLTGLFLEGARAGHEYLVARGVRLPPVERFARSLLWRGRKAMLLNWISRRELNVAELFALAVGSMAPQVGREDWREFILRIYGPLSRSAELDPQAGPVLGRLREAGLKVALVSNTFVPAHAMDAHLRRLGLLELFDARFYSAGLGLKKPSLALFRHAVGTLGVRPEEAWHVGDDLLADVLGARRAGLTAVLRLRPGRRVRWWWMVKPHHAIRRLDELLDLLRLRDALPPAKEGD